MNRYFATATLAACLASSAVPALAAGVGDARRARRPAGGAACRRTAACPSSPHLPQTLNVVSGSAPNRIFNIEWRTTYFYNNEQLANFEVRLYGDVALLGGRTQMTGSYDGKPFASHYRYIDIYVRSNGVWKITSVQITKVPKPAG